MPREQWRDGIRKIRKDYGRVVLRKGEKIALRRRRARPDQTRDATASPAREVAILFDTKFAGNKQAPEEVTMVLENDGIWRVAGYYIK